MNVLQLLDEIQVTVEAFQETGGGPEPKVVLINLLKRLDQCHPAMGQKDIWKQCLSRVERSIACHQHGALEIETRLLWNSFASVVPVKLSNIEPFGTKTLSEEVVDGYRKRIRENKVEPIVVRGPLVNGPLVLLNGREVVAAAKLEGNAALRAVVLRPRVPPN